MAVLDINGDGKVDMQDMSQISAHWYPGPPIGPLGYDPHVDINNDDWVNIIDIVIAALNFDKTYPWP